MRGGLGLLVAVLAGAASAQRWTELGPVPISNGPYTGRVSAIAPSATASDTYYLAGADGGVWRTTNAGASWTAVGDFLPTTSVGALAVDPADDKVVFAGLGEANFAHHSRYGLGIARTLDGGQRWAVFGAAQFAGRCVSRLAIDPKNTSVVYAASTHAGGFLPKKSAGRGHPMVDGPIGVFKSADRGVSWVQLGSGIPTDLSATDLVLDPVDPRVLYAAFGDIFSDARNGIYKSTDGGASWTKLAQGLPTRPFGRVSLALARSRSQRLYAIFVNPSAPDSSGASTLAVYSTDDAGASWTQLAQAGSFQSTYGWYLSVVGVQPTNPDVVVLGGLSLRVSTNAGQTFATRTPPHVDIHALEWDAAGRLLCGNDGGIHVSDNQGQSWRAIHSNLGLVQFYAGMSLHPTDATVMYGGFQDNGSCRRTSGTAWTSVLGGDGGCTGIDPTGVRVFCEYQGTGTLFRSVNNGSFASSASGISTGDRNCFLCPFDIDPRDGLRMIYGTQRVYRSTNGGSSWTPISGDLTAGGSAAIHGLAIAPSDGRYLYVKTNDGRVVVSEDDGANWHVRRTGVPGWVRTTWPFAVHPGDPRRVYLAVGWFGVDQVLYSPDAGGAWQALDGDLPDVPVHAVGVDASQGEPVIVYAGSDLGVWRSVDGGKTWLLYGKGLPHAAVIDLRVDLPRRRLVVATQGRGAWQTDLLDRAGRHREGPGM